MYTVPSWYQTSDSPVARIRRWQIFCKPTIRSHLYVSSVKFHNDIFYKTFHFKFTLMDNFQPCLLLPEQVILSQRVIFC